jgi:hypothetical protein
MESKTNCHGQTQWQLAVRCSTVTILSLYSLFGNECGTEGRWHIWRDVQARTTCVSGDTCRRHLLALRRDKTGKEAAAEHGIRIALGRYAGGSAVRSDVKSQEVE